MVPVHSRKLLELEARKILKMEAKRHHKRIFRGSSSAEDEARFKEITGPRRVNILKRVPSSETTQACKGITSQFKKEKASSVERIWYRKLSCGEDVESVMRNGESSFLIQSPLIWTLKPLSYTYRKPEKKDLKKFAKPLDILMKFNAIVPADEAETQPDLQSAACSRLNSQYCQHNLQSTK